MASRRRLPRLATVALLLVGFLASAALLSRLPETMVTHWNAAGQADGALPRMVGAFVVPVMAALVVPVLYLAPRVDPDGIEESSRGTYEWFVAGFVAFLLYIHGVLLAWNLGYSFPFNGVLAVALAGFSVGCGEFLARVEHSRLGAWGFRATGAATLVTGVTVPSLVVVVMLVGVVATAVGMLVAEDRERETGARGQ